MPTPETSIRCALVALTVSLTACAPLSDADKTGDLEARLGADELADGDVSADGFTRALVPRGAIGYGETVESSFAADGYFGWTFTARAGSRIVLDAVPGAGSDTILLLYGPQGGATWSRQRPIAVNDDYRGTLASHIEHRAARSGTYLVIVRDYWDADGTFSLSLGCTGSESGSACRVECGADDRCPIGAECHRVVCIRAPCPSYCEPLAVHHAGDECDPSECGPAPLAPTLLCSDGSTGGVTGRCIRDAALVCGWERRECPVDVSCGGRRIGGATACAADSYCHYEPAAICGRADATGVCRVRPEACLANYQPVCGCNGTTYSNACNAASAGVSVDHDGPC